MPSQSRMLVDGRAYFRSDYATYIRQRIAAILARRGVDVPEPSPRETAGPEAALPAFVHENRWLTYCDCRGGSFGDLNGDVQFVWLDQPLFMCSDCGNTNHGGLYRPVALPEHFDEISAELLRRPQILRRNWTPAETVEDLQQQTAEWGIS